MGIFYVKNVSDQPVVIRDTLDYNLLALGPAGDPQDGQAVSVILLQRPDVQALWAAGTLSVFADDDYETLVPLKSFELLNKTLRDSYLAAIIGDPDTAIGAAVAAVGSGSGEIVTWSTISGKPAVVAEGADQAAARTKIGAGTSNLALGTTASTAAAGNHTHAQLTADQAAATASIRTLGTGAQQAAAGDHTHAGLAADQAAATASLRTLGTSATSAAAGNHTHAGLSADAAVGTASIRTLGTGALQAAPGNHTHTATNITATAIGPGTATTVQGILAELAARIATLEAQPPA